MTDIRKMIRIILNIIVPLAGILFVCLAGPWLLRFFLPFVIGWIIAMIANPLVKFLEQRLKLVRRHSSVLIIVLVLALVIGLGYFLISRLLWQAINLAQDLPELYQTVSSEIHQLFSRFQYLFLALPVNVQDFWTEVSGSVGESMGLLVQKAASPTVAAAGNVAMRIPNALVNVVVTILSAYFFIAEREKILAFWKKYLPESGGKYYRFLRADVKKLIGGYFLAQFKIMFVVAAILLVGFGVLGIRYGFLLGILIAFLDFLPLFGTGTVLIPWALFKLLSGNYVLAAGLALLYVLTQVVRQMIQPKIVGDSMGLPPLWTLLFLYLGFKFHGISGMILAVPLGILAMKLYEYGIFDSLIENMKMLAEEIQKIRKEK